MLRATRPGWDGVLEVAPELLRHRGDRLGIITRSPRYADLVIQLLRVERLVPGRDVSLVGLLTDEVAQRFSPPVSNASPVPHELARRAMAILFARLDGDDAPASLQLVDPAPLVRRATTARF